MLELPTIPVLDIRDSGPVRYALQSAEEARALRDACLGVFPSGVLPIVPALDRASRRWLVRSSSPYIGEIEHISEALGFSGIWFLNAAYQWGCTALACEDGGVPWLLRTLDWPFAGMGRLVALAHMRGECGDYVSVTWPGYVGALTAMAPHRFAACINQAPLPRRTSHRYLRAFDFAANALRIWRHTELMPPDQLLRRTFELCRDYGAARRLLEMTPVARPAIYTLIGSAAGERCVIERTETDFTTREEDTSASNDWVPCRPGWEGRIGMRRFLTSSFAEATAYCHARRESLAGFSGQASGRDFGWVREPVLNPYTRLAVTMSPASGTLRVIGYEPAGTGGLLPDPATLMGEIELQAAGSSPALQ